MKFLFLLKQSTFYKIVNLIKYENLAILYVGKKKHILPHLNASNTFFIIYIQVYFDNYLD